MLCCAVLCCAVLCCALLCCAVPGCTWKRCMHLFLVVPDVVSVWYLYSTNIGRMWSRHAEMERVSRERCRTGVMAITHVSVDSCQPAASGF